MINQLNLILILILIGIGFGHFQKHTDMGVLGYTITPRIDLEAPLDAIDDIGL
jgi:hypothetical protein